jgi:putative hemolysin
MEALVGTVNDDHQKEPDIVARLDNDGWIVDGQCSMYDFIMHFDLDDEVQDYEYTTVAGLILDELDHVPVAGEKAVWGNFEFEVVDMDGARIDKVIVKDIRNRKETRSDDAESDDNAGNPSDSE